MIRIKDFIKKHPYLSQIIVSLICGLSWAIAMFMFQLVKVPFMPNRRGILAGFRDAFMEIMSIIPMTFFMAAFIVAFFNARKKGDEQRAKKTEEAVCLPRLSQPDREPLLRGTCCQSKP